jgi:Ankyrin repeats (many copies)
MNTSYTLPREFLEENFKLTPTYDQKYPNKAYYFLPSVEATKSSSPELISFLKNDFYRVLQRGADTVLQFKKKTQLIFQNTSYQDVINLQKQPEKFTHTFSIKTAEYHTYIELKDLSNNNTISIGGAPKLKGSKLGYIGLRNDSYYGIKYHVGHKSIHPNHLNPHFNKGSISITFPITTESANKALDLAKTYNNDFKSSEHWFDITGHTGNNCADIANKIMNEIGIEGKINDYYKTDELDLRDQGIMYLVWSDLGTIKFAYYMPYHFIDNLAYTFFGKGLDQLLEYYNISPHPIPQLIPAADMFKYTNLINTSTLAGNTPLHIAIENNNLDFAMRLIASGADINVENSKGESILHLLAKLPARKVKHDFLKALSKISKHINDEDIVNHTTPLTNAVISDDPRTVEILLENGANASYVNANQDNLANIAIYHQKFKSLNLLHKQDSTLIYHDNLEHQIPICEIAKQIEPNSIIENFDEIWANYDQALCKDYSALNAILEL